MCCGTDISNALRDLIVRLVFELCMFNCQLGGITEIFCCVCQFLQTKFKQWHKNSKLL